jgi:hypothetical protein
MYKLGIDNGYHGYWVFLHKDTNNIIFAIEFPQKSKKNNKRILELRKQLPLCKYKYEIANIKKKIYHLKMITPRLVNEFIEKIKPYMNDIVSCNIEKPLEQSINASSMKSFIAGGQALGYNRSILDILEIDYELVSVKSWQAFHKFTPAPKHFTGDKKREFSKQESIRICQEKIPNIKDFWIPKGCLKINDNICDACLIGLYENKK